MWIIQQRLVSAGLTKYKRIIRFNKMIIWVSLAMDVLIVGKYSYPPMRLCGLELTEIGRVANRSGVFAEPIAVPVSRIITSVLPSY